MKYFTEEKDDTEGYREQLLTIKHRLDEEVYEITKYNRFHDGQVDFLGIINVVDEEYEREKDEFYQLQTVLEERFQGDSLFSNYLKSICNRLQGS